MHAFRHRPIRTRIYALIALEFLFGIAYGSFSLTLPILADSIVANFLFLGVIFSLPELFGVFADVPIGEFAKRFGRRKTILYSGTLLALSSLFLMTTMNPLSFILILIFYEVATQSFIIPSDAEEASLTPAKATGRFRSILECTGNLGFSIGPVAAGALLGMRLEYALLVPLIVSFGMIFIALRYLPREVAREKFLPSIRHIFTRDRLMRASFREFAKLGFEGIFTAFVFFSFALHWGFIALMEPLYTKGLGLSELQIGVVYAAFTLPIFFIGILVGRYLDRRGAKGIIVAGLLLHAFSALGFSQTSDVKILFILALVSGVGDALILPAVYTVFDRLSSYHKKEYISGIKVAGESLGYFTGPLVGGIIANFFGLGMAFFYLGAFLLLLSAATSIVQIRAAEPSYSGITTDT